MVRFSQARRVALMLSVSFFGAAAQAAVIQTAYFTEPHGTVATYLVDWNNTKLKADIVDPQGRLSGTYTDDGVRRVVALSSPRVTDAIEAHYDSCGQYVTVRDTLSRLAFKRTSGNERAGTTAISFDTTSVVLEGCDAGLVLGSSSIDDVTDAQSHLRMTARPSMADVVVGARFAGFTESGRSDLTVNVNTLPVDLSTLQSGGQMQFALTGLMVPAAVNSQGWLMMNFAGFTRGYTRLKVDTSTGAETWLMADFVADKAAWVQEILVTRSLVGGSFGTVAQASRQWNSGLFVDTNTPFTINLYRDGTGERISKDLAAGTETRTPLESWVFDGLNIVQTRRPAPTATFSFVRTWEPIGNQGKIRWILEREIRRMSDGTEYPFIAPRVNFYIDNGRATPLPSAATAAAKPAAGSHPAGRGAARGLQP